MAGTNFIHRVAIHTTGETAAPTAPAKGANIADLSAWVIIGTIQGAADEADLDGGSVQVSFMDESGQVRPPRSLTREDIVNFANGVDELTFTAYDGSETLLTVASSLTVASHVTQAVAALTTRTVLIEVNGLWFDYFPKCDVRMVQSAGDYAGDPVKTDFIIRPMATATYKGGWMRTHYQAA